jgi:hypothetical protein
MASLKAAICLWWIDGFWQTHRRSLQMLSKRLLLTALVLGTMLALAHTQTAQARLTRSPDARLAALSALSTSATAETIGTPEPACCPQPCITYRHCGRKICCGCQPPKSIVLTVKDPCTCCDVQVPVCVPACCDGEPTVCTGKGFLCRDIVEYEWCCGFYVRVAFKKCGDLIVTTRGR